MKLTVGSTNPTKIDSVLQAIAEVPLFAAAEVAGVLVQVPEFGHPKTLEATTEGAMNRARQAFKDCDFSFGIEGGLMPAPLTRTGYWEVSVCAIYDGTEMYFGLSSGIEWPKKVLDLILQGRDGSQAMREAGFTNDVKIGTKTGLIGLLSGGRVDRTLYMKQAVDMAIIQLENKAHY